MAALHHGRVTRKPFFASSGRWTALLGLAALLLAAPVEAQTVFGSLEVLVSGPDGPLGGIQVVLSGASLVERQRSLVTTDQGRVRAPNLRPGRYRIEVDAPGFHPQTLEADVRVGRITSLDAVLSPIEFEGSVAVTAEAPLVDRRSPVSSATFDEETLESVPSEREYIDFMDQAPGVTDRSAFGAGGRFEDKYSRGAVTSAVRLNGVNVSRLDFGNTWLNPDFNTVEEIQVVSYGASVQYGNYTGATVNVVTKAGTNDFAGSAVVFYTEDGLRSSNAGGIDDLEPGDLDQDLQASLSLGGPIVREKLTFFANAGYAKSSEAPFGSQFYNDLETLHLQSRFDWQPTERQAGVLMLNRDRTTDDDLGLLAGSGPEIAYDEDFELVTWFAGWQSSLSAASFLDLRYAGYRGDYETDPAVCCDVPRVTDLVTGQAYNSAGSVFDTENSRDEINVVYSHYADDFLKASHDLKAGVELQRAESRASEEVSGELSYQVVSFYGYNYAYAYNYSVHSDSRENRVSAFVEDQVEIGSRVTLTAGARLDSTSIDDRRGDAELIDLDLLSPRVGLVVDLTGQGRFVARGSYGTYYEQLVTNGAIGNAGLAVEPLTFYFSFLPGPIDPTDTDLLRDLLVRPENVIAEFSGELVPIDPGVDSYHTDVLSLGLEAELGDHWALSLDWVSKKDRDFLVQDDRTAHTYAPFEYTNPSVGTTQTLYRRTDRAPSDLVVVNDPYHHRDHELFTLVVRRRPTERFTFQGSVTHQDSSGTVPQSTAGPRGVLGTDTHDNPNFAGHPFQDGRLELSREWQLKLLGSIGLPWGLRAGLSFQLLTGLSWQPVIRSNAVPELRGDPLFTVLLEPRGSRRAASSELLDIRLEKELTLGGHRLLFTVDGLNLLNDDPPSQRIRDMPTDRFPLEGTDAFGAPRALIDPRRYRLGVTWRF